MSTTLQSKLQKIETALTAISNLDVYHYYRFNKKLPYCIWEEVTEASGLEADDHKGEQAIQGAVHYFTRTEYDPMCDSIQEALDGAEDVYWRYDAVDFEEETNTIHHTWQFVVK